MNLDPKEFISALSTRVAQIWRWESPRKVRAQENARAEACFDIIQATRWDGESPTCKHKSSSI